MVADLAAADRFLEGTANLSDVVRALHGQRALSRRGPPTCSRWAVNGVAGGLSATLGDSFGDGFNVISAINDNNDYTGPGTGYRLEGETWEALQRIPQQRSPRDFIDAQVGEPLPNLAEISRTAQGGGLGQRNRGRGGGRPMAASLVKTIGELDHEEVLEALLTGVAEEAFYRPRGCGSITAPTARRSGTRGARLSGSGHCGRPAEPRHDRHPETRAGSASTTWSCSPQSPSLDAGDLPGNRAQRGPLCQGGSALCRSA